MILLEDDFPEPLPIGQVSFKSFLPSKKIYLSQTTRQDFFQVLLFAESLIFRAAVEPRSSLEILSNTCLNDIFETYLGYWGYLIAVNFNTTMNDQC